MAAATPTSRRRAACATRSTSSSSSARTPTCAGPGSRYMGLCPFHDERTPSFSVDPVEKLYHCFGCEAGGDVFTFVQEKEGLDFAEAIESLADRYGVELERESEDPQAEAERRKHRERAAASCSSARPRSTCATCWESDGGGAGARVPASGAGSSEEVLREFRVGYSPSAWDKVLVAARQRPGSPTRSCSTPGWPSKRRRGRHLRPLPRPDHVPAGRQARPGARLRRAGDARRPASRSTSTRARATSTTRAAALRRRPRARARPRKAGARDRSSRATPTCSRCTRRGCARRWR